MDKPQQDIVARMRECGLDPNDFRCKAIFSTGYNAAIAALRSEGQAEPVAKALAAVERATLAGFSDEYKRGHREACEDIREVASQITGAPMLAPDEATVRDAVPREPTPAMLAYGLIAAKDDLDPTSDEVAAIWRAMYDAARHADGQEGKHG
jgi:hypothetical protein